MAVISRRLTSPFKRLFKVFITAYLFGVLLLTTSLAAVSVDSIESSFLDAQLRDDITKFNALFESDPTQAVLLGEQVRIKLANFPLQHYDVLIKLSRNYLQLGKTKQTVDMAKLAKQVADTLSDNKKSAQALNNMGNGYFYQANYEQAIEAHQQALSLRSSLNLIKESADSQNNLGLVYLQMGWPDKALELYQAALNQYQQLSRTLDEADVVANIGSVFSRLNDPEQAKYYFLKAITMYESIDYQAGLAAAKGNLAVVYEGLGDLNYAIELYLQALAINEQLNANYYVTANLNNLATANIKLANYPLAIEYAKKAVVLAQQYQLDSALAGSLHSLANAYLNNNQLILALDFAKQALVVSNKNSDIKQQMSASLLLSNVLKAQGDFEQALLYYQDFKRFNDEFAKQQNDDNVVKAQHKLALVMRDSQIALLEKEKHLGILSNQQDNTDLKISIAFGLVVLLTIFYWFYRRNNKTLLSAQMKLNEKLQKIDASKNDFLQQIAQLLHAPLHTIIELTSDGHKMTSKSTEQVNEQAQELVAFVDDVQDLVRLNNADVNLLLTKIDLAKAVNEVIEQLNQQKAIPDNVTIIQNVLLKQSFVQADKAWLNKILHHLLLRAINHAERNRVEVMATKQGHFWRVSVRDTSEGMISDDAEALFNVTNQKMQNYYDIQLVICKLLVKLHGGRITAASNLGQGTIISFTLPSLE